MFELKKLNASAIEKALQKADRYRLLNEPADAESICRDILTVEPGNVAARTALILSLTDQFARDGGPDPELALRELDGLSSPYERAYYGGIVCERAGRAQLGRIGPGALYGSYEWFRRAMDFFEEAERIAPPGDASALLRWNTCARLLNRRRDLEPEPASAPTLTE
jgi:hypothetical protein